MARADLLAGLIEAALRGDRSDVVAGSKAIAEEEAKKGHSQVARRLGDLIEAQEFAVHAVQSPTIREPELYFKKSPRRLLSDLYLDAATSDSLSELIVEHFRAGELIAEGLRPRRRVLLTGPPGTGKTSVAEALAGELGMPLLVVRYEALIGSYLGETSERLGRLFRAVATEPVVLFFDEFDTIGKERADRHESGEVKRVVSTLLLQFDELPLDTILVAATNHPELLDRAAWRRFELQLELPLPTRDQRSEWANLLCERLGILQVSALVTSVTKTPNLSYADIEQAALQVRRREVLKLR